MGYDREFNAAFSISKDDMAGQKFQKAYTSPLLISYDKITYVFYDRCFNTMGVKYP
jgi:hypothetical protein